MYLFFISCILNTLLFQIVSRGKIVYEKYKPMTNMITKGISAKILRQVSPGGRLLAFYIDAQSDTIVADAALFAVEPTCTSEQVIR